MNISLPFITQPTPRKQKKTQPSRLIKIKSEHTPLEIQNMSMPELEHLYNHGTPTEKEMARIIIHARKSAEIGNMLADDKLSSGSPVSGSPTVGARW